MQDVLSMMVAPALFLILVPFQRHSLESVLRVADRLALFLFPVFLVNNILALFFDGIARLASHLPHTLVKEAYDKVYMGMTESYSIILRNQK